MEKRHALIIDDNRMNIDILGILLGREGIEYSAVEYPKSLSATLNSMEHLDVIFLDLEFLDNNGFRLFAEIRAHPRYRQVTIAACTMHLNQIQQVREAGFDSFLGKPLNAQKFPDQLRRILAGQPVWEV
jgi:CheY-like chemotaxis protein